MTGFVHAKDPAMGVSSYEREEADFYATEAWCTKALLKALKEHGIVFPWANGQQIIWEPACGDGGISNVLAANNYQVFNSDLHDRGLRGAAFPVDFLAITKLPDHCRCIITNPPYGEIAQRFVEHALALTQPVEGMVIMLMRHEWDTAKGRTDLFQSNVPLEPHPFKAKVVLTSRPKWIADSTGSPRHSYAFYVWDWRDILTDKRPLLIYAARTA